MVHVTVQTANVVIFGKTLDDAKRIRTGKFYGASAGNGWCFLNEKKHKSSEDVYFTKKWAILFEI